MSKKEELEQHSRQLDHFEAERQRRYNELHEIKSKIRDLGFEQQRGEITIYEWKAEVEQQERYVNDVRWALKYLDEEEETYKKYFIGHIVEVEDTEKRNRIILAVVGLGGATACCGSIIALKILSLPH